MGELHGPFIIELNWTEPKCHCMLRYAVPNRHNRITVQHALLTAWVKWVNLCLWYYTVWEMICTGKLAGKLPV